MVSSSTNVAYAADLALTADPALEREDNLTVHTHDHRVLACGDRRTASAARRRWSPPFFIYARLGATSRTEAVSRVARLGLLILSARPPRPCASMCEAFLRYYAIWARVTIFLA